MRLALPLGIDDFVKIRNDGFYYVDKTAFIQELLETRFEANLITRPRRFGKSLTMSMLEDFFDIRRDSRVRFEGLEISKETELCRGWMNQWPVVSLTLKSVEGLNFDAACGMLRVLIADLCKKYAFLSESETADAADRELFEALKFQKADILAKQKEAPDQFARQRYLDGVDEGCLTKIGYGITLHKKSCVIDRVEYVPNVAEIPN